LLFQALQLSSNQRPLFPSTSCLVAYSAAMYAGTTPEFSDISLSDFTLDLTKLEEALQNNRQIKYIVPTHLYGHIYDVEAVQSIANKYSVQVIEDAAQSMGASYKGKPCGSFGLASILSFGHTKVLEAGHGGAVLTDDLVLYNEICKLEKKLQENFLKGSHFSVNDMQENYRKEYYESIRNQTAWNKNSTENLLNIQTNYKDCFVVPYQPTYSEKIALMLDSLSDKTALRLENAQLYKDLLNRDDIELAQIHEGSTSWRFTFRIDSNKRDALLAYLRSKNIHCSSWYPYYPRLFEGNEIHLNSLILEKEVVNLWVDGTYSKEQIKDICTHINEWDFHACS
ncbi:DegT/DnrJ/EryC1/StrS family aminotransferase, partial [Paenibacillus sp. TAF58]